MKVGLRAAHHHVASRPNKTKTQGAISRFGPAVKLPISFSRLFVRIAVLSKATLDFESGFVKSRSLRVVRDAGQ